MNIERYSFDIRGLNIEVVRKPIKNLHLGVYPPDGNVRVAAPLGLTKDAIRLAVIGKLIWLKRQKMKYEKQARQTQREMVTGETHYFLGRAYRLRVIEHTGRCTVMLQNKSTIHLFVRKTTSRARREKLLSDWYRQQLQEIVSTMIAKWSKKIGVKSPSWSIRKMKTKWGSCNSLSKKIWLNLELAKKPIQCIEYIVVHELIHLRERHHNDRFVELMSSYLPTWRQKQSELNATSLKYENWFTQKI